MSDSRRVPGRGGRVARRVAAVVGGTLVAVGGVLGYLQTESGNEWLRGQIEQRLTERMDGSAKLGHLRFTLWSGARVERVSLRDKAGVEVVGIQEASVDPALGALLRRQVGLREAIVRGVRLHIEQSEDGTTNLSRLFPPRPSSTATLAPDGEKKPEIHLASVRVEDVAVDVLQRNGVRVSLVGASLSAHVDARPSERDVTAGLTARDLALGLRWPNGQEVNLAGLGTGLEARLVAGAGEVTLGPLAATLGGKAADGRLFEPAPIALGKLSVHLEKGQVTAAVEQLELLALAVGSADARVGLGADGPDYTGQGSLGGVHLGRERLNALIGRPVLASDVDIVAKVDAARDRPGLDLDVKTDGGSLQVKARLDGSGQGKPRFSLEVTSAGLAVQRAVVVPSPVELGALSLKVDGEATRREDASAGITLDLGSSTVRGVVLDHVHAEGRYDRGTLALSSLTVDTVGQHLSGRGDVTPATGLLDVHLETRGELGGLAPALVAAGRPAPPAALVRGVSLRDGLAVDVKGTIGQSLDVTLPGSRVGLAGGAAYVAGHARLVRSPEDASKMTLEEGTTSVRLEGVRLPSLLAMVGRPNGGGIDGRVDGTVQVHGPGALGATYDLTTSVVRGATTVRAHAHGKLSRDSLALDLEAARMVGGQAEPLLEASVRAPLAFAGRKPHLDQGRPLSIRMDVPSRAVDTLRDFLPPPLLLGPLGQAHVGAHVALAGSARAPEGTVQLDVSGPLAARLGGTQKANVVVALAPGPDGAVRVTTDVKGWLREADAPQLTARVEAALARSPLVERPDNASWTLEARLAPQPLASLAPGSPRRGEVGVTVTASGDRADVQGKVEASLRGLGPATSPPLDADVTLAIGAERSTLSARMRGSNEVLATVEASGDIAGQNLLARLREKQPPSIDTPFEVKLSVPDRALSSLAPWLPGLRDAPGTIGGKIELHGPATRASIGGKLVVRDLHAADGTEPRVELSLQGNPLNIGAKLEAVPGPAGSGEGVVVDARISPLLLVAARGGEAPLPVNLGVTARGAKLESLLPSSKHLGSFAGLLDSDLSARVDVMITPDGVRPRKVDFQGALELHDGKAQLPSTSRTIDHVGLRLAGAGGQLKLESLEAHESDREQPDRSLRASGELVLDGVMVREARLDARSSRWLVSGGSFGPADAPRASLDADLSATVAFRPEGRQVRATVRSLELLAPERFLRAHQQEVVSLGDVIEVTGPDQVGRLPVPERPATATAPARAPLTPPSPDTPPKPSDPPTSPPPVAEPARVTEIDIELPPGTHIKQAPLDMKLGGTVRVRLSEGTRESEGKLAVSGGQLFLGGKWQPIDHGEIRFDAQYPGGYLDLWFRRLPHVAALRDVATGNGEAVQVHLEGALGQQKPEFDGLGVGSLFDTLALQNAGRTRYTSQPDMPASETSQLPLYGQLRQMAFVAVNLPHLLFLDRISVWADPYDDRQAYGRLMRHEGESYSASGTTRVKTTTRPPRSPGQSEGDLSFDWLWQNSDRTVSGVGLKAGTRGGGGPGIFWEWSSER